MHIRERLLSSVDKGLFPGACFILHALVANLKSWIAAGGATGAGIASESTCWEQDADLVFVCSFFLYVLRLVSACFICARVPVAWRSAVLSRRGWRHQQPGPQRLCKRLHQHRARRHFSRSLRAQGTSRQEGRDQGRKGYAEGACSSLKNMFMLPRKMP